MRLFTRRILILALLPAAASASVTLVDDSRVALPRTPRLGDPPATYLVITDRDFQAPFTRLTQARTQRGLPASVVTLQSIESKYPSGVDLAERVRLFLRDAYASWGTRWVLLGGDASVVPMRRAFLRLGPGPFLNDTFLPTDQYYACLDGSWNADGDSLWGENPRTGEPGDDVDFLPELFVGRAPVRNASEAAAFVRRTLDYEERLANASPRSALLAAEILGAGFDLAPALENLRPVLEVDPDRSIVRLYENSAAWPGSLQESRPALLDALNDGFDLAVLWGGGLPGVISAGVDPVDHVTSQDLLGLTNAPHLGTNPPQCPIVYVMSAWTTAPEDPLSIGNALLRAPHGGAVAVLGTTDLQFVGEAGRLMDAFFDRAVGAAATPIGEALAGAIATMGGPVVSDGVRLTTQGMMLLGDPALRIDPPSSSSSPATPREVALVRRPGASQLAAATLTLAGRAAESLRDGPLFATGVRRETETQMARARIEAPSLARRTATMRFELPIGATGAYAVNVFDASGRRVRNLGNGAAAPERFELAWDLRSDGGATMPSGVYFVRLQFTGTSLTHRLIVLR